MGEAGFVPYREEGAVTTTTTDGIPPLARVRQVFACPEVADPRAAARAGVLGSRIRERVKAGGRVAVGLGSRGIGGIDEVAKGAIGALKELGFRPFVVAAMGTHGGATPEGQREQLADRGITEAELGVEVRTEMDVVEVGTSPIGLPIYFDRNAWESDGIVLINRVKPHSDFRGRHESGVLKMLVIGLGKRQGAEQVHRLGLRGMHEVLPAVGRILVERTPFALGLAIVENAAERPARIEAIEPEAVFDREPELLEEARGLMGRLPFDQIDVLVVGEIGKDYSGAGMDPNVIGRLYVETQPDFERPKVTRLAVLDVSEKSHGNVVGVGFADLCHERIVRKMDAEAFRINVLTSCFLERARVPIALGSDREVFETSVRTCWRVDPMEARVVVVANTLELGTLWVSPALEAEVAGHARLTRETEYRPAPFLADGTLDQEGMFPDSVRGRRARAAAAPGRGN
jgi:hypothetical protein